jgi:hypothetical protein
MATTTAHETADLIRLEYSTTPGLQLTFWQAQRLWGLSQDECDLALGLLTGSGFLVRDRDGRYRQAHRRLVRMAPAPTTWMPV